jgi:hypothetical protein
MSEEDFGALPLSPDGEEQLQESAADVASIVSAAASVGALGFSAAQAYYARATYQLQREARGGYSPGFAEQDEYDPGFSGQGAYGPGFARQDEYDPGFADQPEYPPGFEDLEY